MQTEKPEECEACGFETTEIKEYDGAFNSKRKYWLCELCAGSMSGNTIIFPTSYSDDAVDIRVIQMIAFCTNMIIKEIRKNAPAGNIEASANSSQQPKLNILDSGSKNL